MSFAGNVEIFLSLAWIDNPDNINNSSIKEKMLCAYCYRSQAKYFVALCANQRKEIELREPTQRELYQKARTVHQTDSFHFFLVWETVETSIFINHPGSKRVGCKKLHSLMLLPQFPTASDKSQLTFSVQPPQAAQSNMSHRAGQR